MQIYFDCNEANYELLLLKRSLCKTFFCQNECFSLKRLRDINKNTISTPLIIAKVSQKLYYDFIALVFLNM